jgi:chromosomal replication initiator protein
MKVTALNEPPFTDQSGGAVAPLGPGLNPRYTFDGFIVGGSNRLAHAASLAVAEKPGVSYNPLFLYGGVGLGKTHLLHAIGHSAVARGLAVLYISSETFTNDIVNAIRYRSTEEFRAKYRSVDILLVDDIQFIAGKESTEEEFFHTFNSLYESSKQIVICSDRPPKSIAELEERLRSRFEWGLIADIQPPDLELRTAILRAKVDLMQREVPNEVIDFVARRVDTNIRELEGSLNRVLVYAELHRTELTVEVARLALHNLAIDFKGHQPTLPQIVRAVADYYHIPEADLRGKQRDRRVVLPRHIAMYLMHQETDASSTDIGNELGGRDHTTAIHGYEKIAEDIKNNPTLKREIEAIRQMLYSSYH